MTRLVGRAAVAAAVLVALAVVAVGCGKQSKSLDLKIGVLVPLTGPRDRLGPAGEEATKLAQQQVDAAIRKTGSGDSVRLLLEDEAADPSLTVEAAKRLKKQKATCVVGPYTSVATQITSNQELVPADIPVISPAASADTLSTLHDADLVNRTVLPDRDQAPALAALMNRELKGGVKGKTASVAAFDSIYGRTLLEAFVGSWKKLGGRIAATIAYKDKSDYGLEVHKLTKKRPDAFVFFDTSGTFGRILPQLQGVKGWSPKKAWAADGLADGQLTTNQTLWGLRGVAPGAPDNTPAARAFDTLFTKANSKVTRQTYDAQAFDAYILCYLAAVRAGSTNGGKLADRLREVSGPPGKKYTFQQLPQALKALRAGKDIDYEGVSGPIDLDRRGDPTAGTYDAYKLAKEKVLITGDVPYPPSS